jgi:hypothetical protein
MVQTVNVALNMSASSLSMKRSGDLTAFVDALDTAIKETEGEFLSLGVHLKKIYTKSRDIVTESSTIAGLLSGRAMSETIDRMNTLIVRMNEYMRYSGDRIERRIRSLKDLREMISDVCIPLEAIRTSAKSFAMFDLSTRMYCGDDADVAILTGNVKKLATDVNAQTTTVLDRLTDLNFLVRQSLLKVISLYDRQRNEALRVLEKAMSSLSSLSEKTARASSIAVYISDLSNKTSHSIGSIITFLQLHDIVCQQVGAVKSMLYAPDEMVSHSLSEEAIHAADARRARLAESGMLCDVQAERLHRLKDKMTTGANTVIKNLSDVRGNVMRVSREALLLARDEGKKEQSFLSKMGRDLSSITSAVSTISSDAGDNLVLSDNVTSTVMKDTSVFLVFLQDIEQIENEADRIAFNAAISAFNSGKDEEVLSVIAESIRRVSADIRCQTGTVSNMFRTIISLTLDLTAGIDEERARYVEIRAVADECDVLTETLHRLREEVARLLLTMDDEWKLLSKEIERAVNGICLHHVIAEACDKVIECLGNTKNAQASTTEMPANDSAFIRHGTRGNIYRSTGEYPALPVNLPDEDGNNLWAMVELF